MDYMHGTSATECSELRACGPEMLGTPEQDARSRRQMASIHVQFVSLAFDRTGSLRESLGRSGHARFRHEPRVRARALSLREIWTQYLGWRIS